MLCLTGPDLGVVCQELDPEIYMKIKDYIAGHQGNHMASQPSQISQSYEDAVENNIGQKVTKSHTFWGKSHYIICWLTYMYMNQQCIITCTCLHLSMKLYCVHKASSRWRAWAMRLYKCFFNS